MKSKRPEHGGNRESASAGHLRPYKLIDRQAQWRECQAALRAEPRLAIDVEGNSMYAYQERVCLIQISIPAADYIIDPEAELDLSPLGNLLDDASVEKVFHAAEYDLILLQRTYGWVLHNLFDTMWAARILGYQKLGLANMLDQFYGVKTSKRYQRANWCRRPLSMAELRYAQTDTHYLLDMRDRLAAELDAQGCIAEAAEIFAEQAQVTVPDTDFSPDGFWSLNGAYHMSPAQQSALAALYVFRDEEARRRDSPPFKVMGDRTLLELAEALPRRESELSDIYGMSTGQQRRYGAHLLNLIAKARETPPPRPPSRPPRPPDDVLNRFETLHNWRKQRARRRGVESDVILYRDILWKLAVARPTSLDELQALDLLGPWRLETYGEDLLRVLRSS